MNQSTRASRLPVLRRTAALTRTEPAASALSLRPLALALLRTLGAAALLLLGASAAAGAAPDPDALYRPLGLAVTAMTAFLGGVFCMRAVRGSVLLCGGLFGLLWTGLLWLLALLFPAAPEAALDSGLRLALRLALPIVSLLGAYLARPRPKVPHRPRLPRR